MRDPDLDVVRALVEVDELPAVERGGRVGLVNAAAHHRLPVGLMEHVVGVPALLCHAEVHVELHDNPAVRIEEAVDADADVVLLHVREPERLEDAHRLRVDVRGPGKGRRHVPALDRGDLDAGLRQQVGERQTGRAAANHGNLDLLHTTHPRPVFRTVASPSTPDSSIIDCILTLRSIRPRSTGAD